METRPRRFEAFALDRPELRTALEDSPLEDTAAARRAPTTISVPAPDGSLERFSVVESPVLAPALAKRFPQIRTYAGESLDHPGETARFDLGPLGFHASVRSRRGLWYVDPYYQGDDGVHVAYYRRDLAGARSPLADEGETDQIGRAVDRAAARRAPGAPVTRRVYRLALANDPSYSTYFGGTDLLVETAKATLINRVNQVYSDDLAIRMELVANDFRLNFKTSAAYATAGYGSGPCNGDLIERNQEVIDRIIRPANYDLGHLVKRSGGGGIATVESVGDDGFKAQGCTGLNPPVGDGFAIDYVAHEIGHQFGGPHTFDSAADDCAPQRDAASAVEPGSGSSIMAYAGLCGDDDLQATSDPYFSQSSIDSIQAYVATRSAGTEEEVANSNPAVAAPEGRTIPVRTPFTLEGSATDPDGDGLVYLWEQNDPGGADGAGLRDLPDSKLEGPLFRIFSSADPARNVALAADRVRSFPDPAQVAADNTDAETEACPLTEDVECNSEVLPTTGRELDFRLTARDRSPLGGGVDHDDVTLTVAGSEPFAVTAPDEPAAPVVGNSEVTVEWDVAGTDAAPFDVADVRISFSTDGGLTFNHEVLESTPNDGSEAVAVPNLATSAGRFKVEAVDNYFFDVSDGDITVTADPDPEAPTPTPTPTPEPEPSAAPTVAPLTVPTATPTPTPTPSPTASPTVTPSVTPTRQPTATPTPAATATVAPAQVASLRPSLFRTKKRLRVSRGRRVAVRVRCPVVGTGTPPATCRGRVELRSRFGRVRRSFAFPRGRTRTVRLTVTRRLHRRLRDGRRLTVTLRATVGGRTTTKRITLRRS